MTFVTGKPSAVKPFRTATRTWNVSLWSGPRSGDFRGLVGFSIPWQEFRKASDDNAWHPGQNICKPSLRVYVVHLCRDDQGIHEPGAVAAARGSGEEPCFPAEGCAAKGTFDRVVRDADAAVIEEPGEGLPAAVFLRTWR